VAKESAECIIPVRDQLEPFAKRVVQEVLDDFLKRNKKPVPEEWITRFGLKKSNPEYLWYRSLIDGKVDKILGKVVPQANGKTIDKLQEEISVYAWMGDTSSIEEELQGIVACHVHTKRSLETLFKHAKTFMTLNESNQNRIKNRIKSTIENPNVTQLQAASASLPQEVINLKVPLLGTDAEKARPLKGLNDILEKKGLQKGSKNVAEQYLELAALSGQEQTDFFESLDQAETEEEKIRICQERALKVCIDGLDLIEKGYVSEPVKKQADQMTGILKEKKQILEQALQPVQRVDKEQQSSLRERSTKVINGTDRTALKEKANNVKEKNSTQLQEPSPELQGPSLNAYYALSL